MCKRIAVFRGRAFNWLAVDISFEVCFEKKEDWLSRLSIRELCYVASGTEICKEC